MMVGTYHVRSGFLCTRSARSTGLSNGRGFPRLISALALSRPTLHMEDFRRKALDVFSAKSCAGID